MRFAGTWKQYSLDEGNAPARQNHDPQGRGLVLEMPIPGYSHEDVGDRQQQNSVHALPFRRISEWISYES